MKVGDFVVVLNHKSLRGQITGLTKDGRLEVDLGDDMGVWIFKPFDIELESRDDLWWK